MARRCLVKKDSKVDDTRSCRCRLNHTRLVVIKDCYMQDRGSIFVNISGG